MLRFTNQYFDAFYPTKINTNLQGNVFHIDSEKTKSRRLIFNVLKVKSFLIKGNEISVMGQYKQPIVAFFIGSN